MSLSRPHRNWEEEEEDRGAGGEELRGSPPAKRPRRCCSCSCCQETKDFYEGQIEILKKEMQCMSKGFIEERKSFQREMQEFYQTSQLQLNELITEQHRRMQECYQNSQLIWEQFNTLISKIQRPADHVQQNNNLGTSSDQSEIRTYRMKFENRCCNDKYSRHDITADDGNPIKVAIYDDDNMIITQGPLSSILVKIVVLEGEFNNDHKEHWSRHYFRGKIVPGRPGKPPLFSNELYLRLENGVANLDGAKFQDNSSFVPSKKFRLGVMAADDSMSEKIQEGISESFAVKDGRGYSTKKDPYPSLSDPVYKLKKIGEKGDRRKILETMDIKLVQHFLWFYNKDKNSLREACGAIPDHDWNIIVRHALSCNPGYVFYSYCIPAMDATIFFNSLYNIVGAKFNGTYISYEKLNNTQKDLVDAYRVIAYGNLKVVVQHEGENAYNEHELIFGDKGSCYLQGSCSMLPCPTPPTRFHDEHSHQDEVSDGGPPRASPHPHQRWVKLVTTVTTLRFWKSATFFWTEFLNEMPETSENNIE